MRWASSAGVYLLRWLCVCVYSMRSSNVSKLMTGQLSVCCKCARVDCFMSLE